MKTLNYLFAVLIFIAILALGAALVYDVVNNYNAGVINMNMLITCAFGYLVITLFLVTLAIVIIEN